MKKLSAKAQRELNQRLAAVTSACKDRWNEADAETQAKVLKGDMKASRKIVAGVVK